MDTPMIDISLRRRYDDVIPAADAFRRLAGKQVQTIRFVEDHAMLIVFDTGEELHIGARIKQRERETPLSELTPHLGASVRLIEPVHRDIAKPSADEPPPGR